MGLSAVLAFPVAGPTIITSTLLPGANGNPLISARRPALTLTVFRTVRKDFAICMALHLTFRKCTRSASNQQHPIVGVLRGKLEQCSNSPESVKMRDPRTVGNALGEPAGSKSATSRIGAIQYRGPFNTFKPFNRFAPFKTLTAGTTRPKLALLYWICRRSDKRRARGRRKAVV